jgi:UDP-N-acetyl-D-mannosaminuronate dehydrogenase
VTTDAQRACRTANSRLVCVGTPSAANGSQDQGAILRLAEEMGLAIARQERTPHMVVFRSTLVPGTVEDILRPIIEAKSGKKDGEGFFLCFQPEFLREGSSIRDYDKPPFTVVGANHAYPIDRLRELFGKLPCRFIATSVRSAEMMKYCCNNFHALKITFANETARLCDALGVDPFEVMNLVCQDTQLNISTAYLRPGFAFGGSCLPKDLRATTYLAKMHDVEVPMLAGIMQSNRDHLALALRKLLALGRRKIGFIGLSFKTGYRRPAREPAGDARRTTHRQRHATGHLRSRGPSRTAARCQPQLHRTPPAAHRRHDAFGNRGGDRRVGSPGARPWRAGSRRQPGALLSPRADRSRSGWTARPAGDRRRRRGTLLVAARQGFGTGGRN